jgi:hypothetical protein
VRVCILTLIFLVEALIFLLQGCAWIQCATTSPQAAVDYFDWARERNERAVYEATVDRIEERGAPYCSVDLDTADYPVIFSILDLENPRYIPEANAVVYRLGDHENMAHEFAHFILIRGDVSQKCLYQLAAEAVSRELESLPFEDHRP